jgi:hypothetical protein
MAKAIADMGAVELWQYAQSCLASGRLREAKEALDEMGLRFDDAYARLEAKMQGEKEAVWS